MPQEATAEAVLLAGLSGVCVLSAAPSPRSEPLDHLEAPGLLDQHALVLLVAVSDLDNEPARHPADEITFRDRVRDKLVALRIGAFADECQLLELSFLICCHDSSLLDGLELPANRRYTINPGRTDERTAIVGRAAGYAVGATGASRARRLGCRASLCFALQVLEAVL